jgi:hypothetical protein
VSTLKHRLKWSRNKEGEYVSSEGYIITGLPSQFRFSKNKRYVWKDWFLQIGDKENNVKIYTALADAQLEAQLHYLKKKKVYEYFKGTRTRDI